MREDALNDPQPGDPETTAARYRSGPSARVIKEADYDPDATLRCPLMDCGWSGAAREADRNSFDELFDVRCPRCDQMLLIVPYAAS